MKIISIIFCLLLIEKAYSCDCPPRGEYKNEYAQQYDYIFLAQIKKEVENGIFEIEILEVYKGNPKASIKVSDLPHDNCMPKVNTAEKWLIYTNKPSTDVIQLEPCTRSRNLKSMGIPPPPTKSKNKKVLEEFAENRKKAEQRDKEAVEKELQELRKLN